MPFIVEILVGLFYFLALAAGFVMTLVALGTVGGYKTTLASSAGTVWQAMTGLLFESPLPHPLEWARPLRDLRTAPVAMHQRRASRRRERRALRRG